METTVGRGGRTEPRALLLGGGRDERIGKGHQEGVASEADEESSTWCSGSKTTKMFQEGGSDYLC